ncbi:DUF1501 domain-containing protein [Roseibacillus ishigakijimensis]|uniref:DUF1501 domain-containing protein n=1 Tax=Roseibacillus ishigakijimensis TaxID=454146 RepID=A0A934RTC5_9BACT|nr:DUF1501 domain-containing protein [Roseibacillus ishigakijimensis]MBK1834141.1 DUF1501 domain-containing protein [Roseibacillus ishigakijimensis]
MILNRRDLLRTTTMGFGTLALNSLLHAESTPAPLPHLVAKAKRVIFLFQSGGPSQVDLLDPKPLLNKMHGEQLPDSVRGGQRLTGMSGNQSSIPLAGSPFEFMQHGQSGQWFSEILPHTSEIADDICVVKNMYTEAINHGPGVTFLQTGSQLAGRPSMGAWMQYGLGTSNKDLPAFVVLVTKNKSGQPLVSRLWGSGFLPSEYQGIRFRSGKDPVLYLTNPEGVSPKARRQMLDRLAELHQHQHAMAEEQAILDRIQQYEMAFNMQSSVPDVANLSDEPESTFKLYGEEARDAGTYAANCLMARRLAERGVKFIQLYHQGWDQHGGLKGGIMKQCQETDRGSAALVKDLKQRGLLEDTLVVWGGEFGRTNYSQGKLNGDQFGRDHHPRCFSMWLAGGGIKGGTSFGQTDDYGYNIVNADGVPISPTKHHYTIDATHVHDLQATILHLMGIDHTALTYKFQGRRFRLTDVHGKVVEPILA